MASPAIRFDTQQRLSAGAPRSGHGQDVRGLYSTTRSSTENGRFGRMFRWLEAAAHPEDALMTLGALMQHGEFAERRAAGDSQIDTPIGKTEPEDENPTIPAGYTYLGQFIDHDITFDPVSSLQARNDPDALEDFRTPRFDLDSLYGRGPVDQPYLYKRGGLKFLYGPERRPAGVTASRPDLPRNSEQVALAGDKRNDENMLVSQIHTLFKQFHDRMIEELAKTVPEPKLFEEAQRLVRWHYQWIILNDYLPRIVGRKMTEAVLGRKLGGMVSSEWRPNLRFYRPRSSAYMPVEFSVAAFRFGHSMVRPSYSLSEAIVDGSDKEFHRIPLFSDRKDDLANLNGFRPLPANWGVDWSFFFDGLRKAPAGFRIPQPSYRLNTRLVDPLSLLPEFKTHGIRSLAQRNLLRGLSMGLPSGQNVAAALGIEPMSDAQLWSSTGKDRDKDWKKLLAATPQFEGSAPLWFYILREAQNTRKKGVKDSRGGHHLGPVGGRIVAEVLVGLAWSDHYSYLYQSPNWQPDTPLAPKKGQFTMTELIRFVER